MSTTEDSISNEVASLNKSIASLTGSETNSDGKVSVGGEDSLKQQAESRKGTFSSSYESQSRAGKLSRLTLSGNISVKKSTQGSGTHTSSGKNARLGEKRKSIPSVSEAGLTSNQMREKLYLSFRSKGVLENVKTQLRANLASVINENGNSQIAVRSEPESFFVKLSDILVAEHLKQAKYEYTLSIFKSESAVSGLEIIPSEMLKLMRIHPGSKKFDKMFLSLSQGISKSFLWNFLTSACDESSVPASQLSVACQTESEIKVQGAYIGKSLSKIEEELNVSAKSEFFHRSLSLEERLFQLQKRLEDQKKKELRQEKERLKENLLREVKLQEREKNKEEIDRFKTEIEKSYRELTENVRQREIEANEMLIRKQKHLEQEMYEKRQGMLEEMQKMKERESEMKRANNIAMQSIQVEEAKLRTLKDQLRVKELSLQSIEEQNEIKLKEAILKLKIENQEKRQEHESVLRSKERQLQEEKDFFEHEKESLLNAKAHLTKLNDEKMQMEASLNAALKRIGVLNSKSESLKEKLKESSDYHQIKAHSVAMKKEMEYLKSRVIEVAKEKKSLVEENRKQVNDIMDSILKGNPETVQIKQQMERERIEFSEKEGNLKDKILKLEQRLRSEISRNSELAQMYESCMLQNKALRRDVEDAKGAQKSHAIVQDWQLKKMKMIQNMGDSEKHVLHSNLMERNGQSFGHVSSDPGDENESITAMPVMPKLTANHHEKDVIVQLEREAIALEDTYRSYQRKESGRNPPSYGMPHTNEYKPLQEYYSVLNNDELKQLNSATYRIPENKETATTPTNSEQFDMKRSLAASSNVGAYRHLPVKVKDREGDFQTNSIEEIKSYVKSEKFQDTWNGDHLTEQLLESAVIPKEDGLVERKVTSKTFGVSDIILEDRDEAIAEIHEKENFGGQELIDAGDKEKNETILFPMEGELALEDHKRKRDNESSATSSNILESQKLDDSQPSRTVNDIEELDISNRDTLGSCPDTGSLEREILSKQEEVQAVQMVKTTEDLNFVPDLASATKEKGREISAEKSNEVSLITDSGKDNGEPSFQENIQSPESIKKTEEENIAEGEDDDENQIDPLMKHYMDMLSKKRHEGNTSIDAEEQLNLTDDVKLVTKSSKSELSGLLEDELEEIEQDPVDDFDW